MTTPNHNEEEESFESILLEDLERDIYNSLSEFQKGNRYPYVEQVAQMVSDYHESGYMTFLINYKELSDNLRGYLQKDNSYYPFIKFARKVVNYLIYKHAKDYVQEYITNPLGVEGFDSIQKHIPIVSIRLKNFNYDLSIPDVTKAIPIRAARAASMSRLQVFKGIAIAIAEHTTDMVKWDMTCDNDESCGKQFVVNFYAEDQLSQTSKCPSCDKGNLIMTEQEFHDVQIITLHDMNDAKTFTTSVQSSLKVAVSQDLVNKVEIGDSVIVTGMQRLDLDDERSKKQWLSKAKNNEYYVQMDNFRSRTGGISFPRILDANYIEVNETDDFSNFANRMGEIEQLKKRPDLYELLIKSFCPQVEGYTFIKEGLLLALVGGVGRNTTGGKIDKRGNIHVMIISDPSQGKSELLKYCAKLLKRGIYVSATSSSKVGLTGAANRDERTGKWIIEAGAILRANNSVLCIDEIGKLPQDSQSAIYQVAEQEEYTFNKAGILKTFPVNITLIVAGNPLQGRFNPDLSTSENLGHFEAPFLSRFDEKHTMRDIPNEVKDKSIVRHVLKQINGQLDTSGLISFELLSSYASYVRNYGIQPKLTPAAMEYIADYYWSKRKDADPNDMTKPTPIAVREMEGLARMCCARARLIWQEIVDVEDVKAIEKLHENMIYSVAFDSKTGKVDLNQMNGCKTAGQAGLELRIFAKLKEVMNRNGGLRASIHVFFADCKTAKLGSKNEIETALKSFEDNGWITMNSEDIELKKKD